MRVRLGGLFALAAVAMALPSAGIGATSGPTVNALDAEANLSAAAASWAAQGALGQYRDPTTGRLVVDVPESRAGGFSLGANDVSASIRVVPVDAGAVQAVLAKLQALADSPAVSGQSLAFFFYPREVKVMVRTTLSAASIQEAVGNDFALVDYHADRVIDLSRCADIAPFWGGGTITACAPNAICTTGFVVKDGSGTKFLTTAGHCFASNGTQVFTPDGVNLGSIANRHCSNSVDVEEIAGKTYQAKIYTGGASGTSAPVEGSGDPGVGFTYWWSGATTFENSTTLVSTSMTYVSPACGTINNAMVFQNVEKDQCFAGGGDSGAPFYLKSGSNVYARGTVNAKDSEFCYGMKWSTISNALGVTIVTF